MRSLRVANPRSVAFLVTALLLPAWTAAQSRGQILHVFSECGHPAAPLVAGGGRLYGTATGGGTAGNGCVFELSPTREGWAESVIWNPGGFGAGAGGLTFDKVGNLYGAWAGAVFELSPTLGGGWRGVVLHNFADRDGGLDPQGNLAFDSGRNIYGTANFGGPLGGGTVFRLSPGDDGWTETVLYSFPNSIGGPDGEGPMPGVVVDRAGNLYGVTQAGGEYGYGAVFELSPSGNGYTETLIHSFDLTDGYQPTSGLAIDQRGNLFGTTFAGGDTNVCYYVGCGVVFELTKDGEGNWNEKVLHEMEGSDGTVAVGPVAFDQSGNLYAAAEQGGILGMGSVFMLSPTQSGKWTETVLHRFDFKFPNGGDGEQPYAGVIVVDDKLFGTTSGGGIYNDGIVFEITPPASAPAEP